MESAMIEGLAQTIISARDNYLNNTNAGLPQTNGPPQNMPPPPPYANHENNSDSDANSDDEGEENNDVPNNVLRPAGVPLFAPGLRHPPIRLTINASQQIQGSNNLIPVPATPLNDALRVTNVLLAALTRGNSVPTATIPIHGVPVLAAGLNSSGLDRELNITINCGISVVGDRNTLGHWRQRPVAATTAVPGEQQQQQEETVQQPSPTQQQPTTEPQTQQSPKTTTTASGAADIISPTISETGNSGTEIRPPKRKAEDDVDVQSKPPTKKSSTGETLE